MNTDTHPTPVHIRSCIIVAMTEYNDKAAKDGRDFIPYGAIEAVKTGVAKACAEHDEAKNGR